MTTPRRALASLFLLGTIAPWLWGCPGASGSLDDSPNRRFVAVTFDGLPVAGGSELTPAERLTVTQRLLGTLARVQIPAVGFVNEYQLHGFDRDPGLLPDPDGVDLLRMWLDAGHELGNHGFALVDLNAESVDAFESDVVNGAAVIGDLSEQAGRPLRYFRHPYLHTGPDARTRDQVKQFLAESGYRIAPVTVENDDEVFDAAYRCALARGDAVLMRHVLTEYLSHSERAFARSERLAYKLFGRRIRQVLQLHANVLNADALDGLARLLIRRGYSFVPLDEALEDPAYRSPDRYAGPASLTWLSRWAITRGEKSEATAIQDGPRVPDFIETTAAEAQAF